MKKVTKFNFKTLLVLFLSITLCLSTALTVACNNDDSSSSSSSSSTEEEVVYPTDTQTVLNGDFEFSTFTKDNDDFPVASSISWVRSSDSITSSAVSSSYTSGIINTEAAAYAEIASKAGFHKIGDTEEYFNPGTPFDIEGVYADGDFFVNEEDAVNDDKLVMQGSKILMIHNEVKGSDGKGNGEGTAQKFTSSASLSLGKHEFAKLTVWVMTHDLVSAYASTNEFGAYIAVQNTVSAATTPLVIKNINTNSQWAKYTIYLAPSDFATSSFKVVLGLGFGSKEIRREYVEGFAYFDNVHFETISKADYDTGIAEVDANDVYKLYTDIANPDDVHEVVEDLTANEFGKTYASNDATTGDKFTNRTFSLTHARNAIAAPDEVFKYGTSKTNEYVNGQLVNADDKGNAYTKYTLADALTAVNTYLGADKEIKAFDESVKDTSGALYFLHTNPSSSTYTSNRMQILEGKYSKLSFWVKVDTKYPTDTALTVTLNDYGTDDTLAAEPTKTVIASNVNTRDYENDNYNGWMEYIIYISNTLDADANSDEMRYFTLTFDFGTTANSITNVWDLTEGYAIVSGYTMDVLTEKDYGIADTSTYTYAKKVSLSADRPNGVESEEENKDSYNFTYGANDKNYVKKEPATNVVAYTGVVGGSTLVGGQNDTAYAHEDVVAGVINSEYASAYGADVESALNGLTANGENQYVQPLMIKTTGTTSFGYVGSNATISAGTTMLISVDVKVTDNAEAYIYLTNSDALDSFNVLGAYLKGQKVENGALVDSGKVLDKEYVIKVTAADTVNGWATVRFVITAGDDAIAYRTELWNGERDGEAKAGIVLFDNYSATSVASIKNLRDELRLDYGVDYSAGEIVSIERIPTLITYTDDDGNDATKYKEYEATDVYEYHASILTMFVDLTTVDAVTEIDNTTSEDESEDDTTEDGETDSSSETSFSWALQITSIIIAGVLVALLIVVLVRMLVKKYRKNKGSSNNYYNRDSREKAGLAIEAKNARKAKEAAAKKDEDLVVADEEVQSYDYDNMENNLAEEISEESSEEVVENEEVSEENAEESTEEKPEDNGENN